MTVPDHEVRAVVGSGHARDTAGSTPGAPPGTDVRTGGGDVPVERG